MTEPIMPDEIRINDAFKHQAGVTIGNFSTDPAWKHPYVRKAWSDAQIHVRDEYIRILITSLREAEAVIEFYSRRKEFGYTDIGNGDVRYGDVVKDAGQRARDYLKGKV